MYQRSWILVLGGHGSRTPHSQDSAIVIIIIRCNFSGMIVDHSHTWLTRIMMIFLNMWDIWVELKYWPCQFDHLVCHNRATWEKRNVGQNKREKISSSKSGMVDRGTYCMNYVVVLTIEWLTAWIQFANKFRSLFWKCSKFARLQEIDNLR